MKKWITLAALVLAQVVLSNVAQANEVEMAASPVWVCRLGFTGQAKGAQFLIGHFGVRGTGEIECHSARGDVQIIPVKVTIGALPVAPVVAMGVYDVVGQSADLSLFGGTPEDLLGDWMIVNGQAAIIGGLGTFAAVHAAPPQLSAQFSLQVLRGFGLNIGLTRLQIQSL